MPALGDLVRWARGFIANPIASPASEGLPLPPRQSSESPPGDLSMVLGTSGQKYSGGHGDEEYHAALSNRDSAVEIYDQLRTGSALVAGPLGRIEAQLRQAEWNFAPAPRIELPPSIASLREDHELTSEDLALADLEHEAMQLHSSWLLGGPAQEYAMETSWLQQALHEACLFMAHPSAIFEVVRRRVDGRFGTKLVPQRLCWMHPRSIKAFKIDEAGRLKGIVQVSQHGWDDREDETYGGGQVKEHRAFIPAEKLLIVSRNREGTLPEGTPFSRHMYADADRASHLIKWSMVDAQNRAVGIPFVEIPKGVHGKVVTSAIAQARRMTYGNQHLAYVVAPEGIKVGYVDMSANTVDLDQLVRQQERRMRHVTSTEFTALGGDAGTGAMALAKVLREEFNVVSQGVAAAIIEDIQRGLVEAVHRVNYGSRVAAPRLEAHGLLAVDSQDLAALVTAKVIPADRDVANVARRAIGLGPLTSLDSEIDTSQLNDLALAKAVVITGEVANAIHAKLGLPALPLELKDKYDREPVNAPVLAPAPSFAGSPPASFAASPGKVTKAQFARAAELKAKRAALIEAAVKQLAKLRLAAVREIAAKATTSDTGMRLGGRLEPSKPTRLALRAAIREAALEMLEAGRRSMLEEGRALSKPAKVDMATAPRGTLAEEDIPASVLDELTLVSELNADAILDAIEPALRKAYWHAREGGASAAAALDAAVTETAAAGARLLDAAAHETAGVAVNVGRSVGLAEVQEILAGEGVQVEHVTRVHVGSDAPCDPCRELHGRRVRIDSPEYATNEPPRHCLGRERCHCAYLLDLTPPPAP